MTEVPMSTPGDQSTEKLLRDSRWIGRLALSLVGDANTAQDLVQETWLIALREENRSQGRSRAWLAGVLHNLARKTGRGDRRRARREKEREIRQVPSAEDLILRAEAQQRVARAVLELEEPLRSTLLLRFFEDLTPAEIAAEQGIAPDSVRARIRRGVQQLRSDLGESDPDFRTSWCALLLPTRRPDLLPAAGKTGGAWQIAAWPLAAQLALPASFLIAASLWYFAMSLGASEDSPVRWQPTTQGLAAPVEPSPKAVELAVQAPGRSRQALQGSLPAETIGGAVTFVLPDGKRIQNSPGELRLLIGSGDTSQQRTIPIEEGRWEVSLSSGDQPEVQVEGLSMDHDGQRRRALRLPQWVTSSDPTASRNWTVPVEALACVHILSSDTGAKLNSVQVLADSREFIGSPLLDNAHRRSQVLSTGSSPLWIPLGEVGEESYSVWAGGEGFQWQAFDLATDQDSERWVRLAEGGELWIQFEGGRALQGCELQLESRGPERHLEEGGWHNPIGAVDDVRLTGLPPGRYWASLDFQPTFAEYPLAVHLGSCPAQIYPDEQTVVILQRGEVEETPTLELRAGIRIPPAWELEDFHLRVYPIRAGTAFQSHAWTEATLPLDEEGRARLHIRDLQAGTYLLDFFSVGVVHHRMVVDLEAPLARVQLKLPPPVELRILVVDAQGFPQALKYLYCSAEQTEGVAGRATAFDCEQVLPGGWIPIRAPAGQTKLSLQTKDGHRVTHELDAQGGPLDVVLAVE